MVEHRPAESDLILYRTEDGRTRIEVRLAEETVWMAQAAMAELYRGTKQNISLHLKNIFVEGELEENRVVKECLTAADWKGAKVRKSGVTIAKNYLNAEEMEGLNRIVTMYLDYAEDQALRQRQIFMRTWREKLDAFLQFNAREILRDAGKVTKAVADQLALEQYEIFNQQRLKQEAQKEALADDTELKKYLEGDK